MDYTKKAEEARDVWVRCIEFRAQRPSTSESERLFLELYLELCVYDE